MNKDSNHSISTKQIKVPLIALAVVSTIVLFIIAIFRNLVLCDDAYYLCMVERISEGYFPYETLALGYTPLYIYILAAFKALFHIPYGCYSAYLAFHFCIVLGCAFLIYAILSQIRIKRGIALFCSWLFIIMTHWIDGNCVILEIPSIFWGLLSSLLILKYSHRNPILFTIIGLICCFSFLSKQYGAGFFLLNLFLILFCCESETKLRQISYFIMGYLIPIIICLLIWGREFIGVVFSGYGTQSAVDNGIDFTIDRRFRSIWTNMKWFLWRVNPMIVVSLLLAPLFIKHKKFSLFTFCWCGIIGFAFQFFFVFTSRHYFLYIVPFGIFLIGMMLSFDYNVIKCGKYIKYCIYSLTAITVLFSVYSTFYNRLYKQYIKKDARNEQIEKANIVKSLVSPNEKIWIHGPFEIYYLANRLPPNLSTIGYSFCTFGLDERKAWEQVKNTDFVVRYTEDYDYLLYFTPEIKQYIEQFPFVAIADSSIVIQDLRTQHMCPKVEEKNNPTQ